MPPPSPPGASTTSSDSSGGSDDSSSSSDDTSDNGADVKTIVSAAFGSLSAGAIVGTAIGVLMCVCCTIASSYSVFTGRLARTKSRRVAPLKVEPMGSSSTDLNRPKFGSPAGGALEETTDAESQSG
ncbi:hypothetical protein T492DRAFT_867889 [Pavlovales sp. CCMP2436]|nr:hypothetical protein T492DRAFT_867889 [Pavlovales sp. CCMP2436]